MSYELLFTAPGDVDHAAFAAHFGERPHYSVNALQAWYANEDTGVYFSFDFIGPEERASRDPDDREHWASITLNLVRPHFFAREAAIEIGAFHDRFPGPVRDPQRDDGDDAPAFSEAAFVESWTDHNHRAAAALGSQDLHRYDGAALDRIWRWNYGRFALQKQVGHGMDVPYIAMYLHEGSLVSASIWTDAIPTVVPRTDVVLLVRDALARRRLFRKRPTVAAVAWGEIEPMLAGRRVDGDPVEHWFPGDGTDTASLESWFRAQPTMRTTEGVAFDHVLDDDPDDGPRAEVASS